MKLPVIQYQVTVHGSPVATFATERAAVKVSGEIGRLVAAAGGTITGAVGFGAIKSVVDADLDGIPGTLDTAAMADAFNREAAAQARKAAESAAQAAAQALLDAERKLP